MTEKKKGSGLRPEKELPERRSGAFRHKNTPVYYYLYFSIYIQLYAGIFLCFLILQH
jgi:hypothetical protein